MKALAKRKTHWSNQLRRRGACGEALVYARRFRTFQAAWKACDKAKIRRRRVHDTRHTFASLLLSNGESLKYVSTQLGHKTIRMTADVYGHLEIGSNRAAVDRLPSLPVRAAAGA